MTSDYSQATAYTATIAKHHETSKISPQEMKHHAAPVAVTHWQPAVEIRHTQDCIDVQLQLPGFEREDIEVQAFETAIVIRGAHFPAHHGSKGDVLTSEFCYGAFERVVQLPEAIVVEQVQAELSYGLLTISLFKATAI